MFEKKLYQEIPGGRNKFHSAILTSFSFNFHHFEFQVLRTLRQKWISSVIILADQQMLDDVLGVVSGNLKQLSQSYSVIGIESSGAFHPKINLLIGDDKLILFFGSGNITPGGHGKNHELFTGFYVDKNDQKQLPLILEAWNYIKRMADNIEGYTQDRLLKVLPGTCSMLNEPLKNKHVYYQLEDSIEIAFLYNDKSTIFEQLTTLIPGENISVITVVSPYYDEDGKTLLNLKEHFSNAKMEIFVPTDFGLPPVKMVLNKSISFYSWEETERGKETISSSVNYERKLHSKIFHFKSGDYEYCLIGSANATVPGLGSLSERSSNDEFCALYKTNQTGLLDTLGVSGTKKSLLVSNLTREKNIISGNEDANAKKTVRLTSADLHGSRLKVFYKLFDSNANYVLSIYNGSGIRIYNESVDLSEPSPISIQLHNEILKLNPGYVLFEDENGNPTSNKQIINFVDKLLNTDPSTSNRSIRQIINAFEGGNINEFEIIEFINDLNRNVSDSGNSQKINIGSRGKNEETFGIYNSEMTYEEAVVASKNSSKSESIFRGHSSTRLWETISRLFQEKKNIVGEELMDEEEEGNAEKGRERNEAGIEKTPIVVKDSDHFKRMVGSARKLSENYIQSLKKICYMNDHKVNELDFGNFLLTTHVLTVVCNFNEYSFEKPEDQYKCAKELERFYIDSMLEILVNFTCLIIRKKIENYQDNNYQKSKLEDYLQKTIFHFWLYVHLIQRKTSEPVVINKMELAGLNFLHFLGKPNPEFQIYLNNISAAYNDMYFNPLTVGKQYNNILDLYNNQNERFIAIDHSGICKVLSSNSKEIEYSSLFSHGRISHAKQKKQQLGFNIF